NAAIDKYRKKKEPVEEPETRVAEHEETPMIEAAEEPEKIEAPEETPMIEAPAEPVEVVEEPVQLVEEEKPKKAEKPKRETKTRSLRGKRSSDKVLTPEQEQYRDMLLDLSTTHNANVLGENNTVIRQVAVKSLVNSLKEDSENVVAIVFDGVISQRILDVSSDKGIRTVIGTRKGNITKMPADITIWTKEDLY
ncbi:MAG: DNA primase, partial [Candidatus Methanomethylophilaceae archaeon]|nr:DNA primase [Candidatus Methanomethylophilaceae archaeon]